MALTFSAVRCSSSRFVRRAGKRRCATVERLQPETLGGLCRRRVRSFRSPLRPRFPLESESITLHDAELSEARWFERAEVRAALEGKAVDFAVPPAFSIAHHLIRSWVDSE